MKKPTVSQKQMEKIHPYIPEMYDQLKQGRVSRREFMRMATLLGMSAGAAMVASACGAQPQGSAGGAEEAPAAEGEAPAEGSSEEAAATSGEIKRGGTYTKSMQLQLLDHPARLSWVEGANIVRQLGEYLTETGPDNITRPYLLDSWEASEDVTTWDLYLRQGVLFNNGDELTADDVIFTIGEWLNPDVGSSMLGLLSALGGMQDVEKVDDYHIRLNLQAPDIAIPENLFHYPAIILHRNFEGDIIKQPIGTGAFTLEEYAEGERAVFKRREDYWGMRDASGQWSFNEDDNNRLPYLDEVVYVSTDKDAGVAALQSGQIDSLYDPRPSDFLALKELPSVNILGVGTAQALVLRMRVDLEPWNDVKVRQALKMCQDRAKNLQLAYFGEGELSIDAHVAPVHPAYCEQDIPEFDPEAARALLAEAGYPDGLQVTLATKNDQNEPELAQALRETAAEVGIDITLDITEPGGYWDRWTEVDLGITSWTHRPLGTMVLPLAYTEEAIGNWNETRWTDEEFEEKLREAQATLDVEARRAIMCDIETIMQERGPIGNSFWKNVWTVAGTEFKNIKAHPTAYDLLYDVWKDA